MSALISIAKKQAPLRRRFYVVDALESMGSYAATCLHMTQIHLSSLVRIRISPSGLGTKILRFRFSKAIACQRAVSDQSVPSIFRQSNSRPVSSAFRYFSLAASTSSAASRLNRVRCHLENKEAVANAPRTKLGEPMKPMPPPDAPSFRSASCQRFAASWSWASSYIIMLFACISIPPANMILA